MSKAFDITIRPKKTPVAVKPTNHYQSSGLLFFGVVIIVTLVIIDFSNNSKISTDIVNNPQIQSENIQTPDTTAAESQNSLDSNPTQKTSDTVNNLDNNSSSNDAANIEDTQLSAVIDKSKISIKILNGARIPQAANNTRTLLEKQGFVIEKLGNAKNLYQHTVIYYKKDKKNEAVLVQLALENQNILIEENNSLTVDSDILIVIGLK